MNGLQKKLPLSLPYDILFNQLFRNLGANELLSFRAVSRAGYRLISLYLASTCNYLHCYHKEREFVVEFSEEGHKYTIFKSRLFNLEDKINLYHDLGKRNSSKSVKYNFRTSGIHTKQDYPYELQYTSATTLIKKFFPVFIEDLVIENLDLPSSEKYLGMSPEEIKIQWEEIRTTASEKGVRMHEYLEYIMNSDIRSIKYNEDCHNRVLSFQKELSRGTEDYKWLNMFEVYKAEWKVFHEDYFICGMVDCVLIEPGYAKNKNGYTFHSTRNCKKNERPKAILVDWKRCKEIKFEGFQGETGNHTYTQSLQNCNFNHYSIQLNIYKKIVEEKYYLDVIQIFIVNLNPTTESCDIYKIKPMPLLTGAMFAYDFQQKCKSLKEAKLAKMEFVNEKEDNTMYDERD